ncbi:MazG-like family protein [Marinilactibacillus psychrotolerans]|uniref:MazG-like family protein n=1 Tax=Marinilactibacillus psychrotolerans TaxID=191770 RepID=UPI0039AEB7E5
MDKLVSQVEQWSKEKGLNQAEPTKQFLKVSEEFGEIGAALARGNVDMFKDAVGDTVVTLIILAQQKGYTLEECLQVAYDEIKGRQGRMVDGVFVKVEDLK